jgi:hypothetical protein
VGAEYGQSEFTASVGYRNVNFHNWHCEDTREKSVCDSYFDGVIRSDVEGQQESSLYRVIEFLLGRVLLVDDPLGFLVTFVVS